MFEPYTLWREDPETGEELEIPLEVEIAFLHIGSAPGPRAIEDDPSEIELGDIWRADTGERFEPSRAELDRIADDLFWRLAWGKGRCEE